VGLRLLRGDGVALVVGLPIAVLDTVVDQEELFAAERRGHVVEYAQQHLDARLWRLLQEGDREGRPAVEVLRLEARCRRRRQQVDVVGRVEADGGCAADIPEVRPEASVYECAFATRKGL